MMLLSDFDGFHPVEIQQSISMVDSDRIEQALSRLDTIYACPNQRVLDDLHRRGLIPAATEVVKNRSDDGTVSLHRLGSRQQFIDALDQITGADQLIYQIAAKCFPQYVTTQLASDEELIAELETRFEAEFTG